MNPHFPSLDDIDEVGHLLIRRTNRVCRGAKYESDELASKMLSQDRPRIEMCQGMIVSVAFVDNDEKSVAL